jgi:hypothetical protein
VAIAVASLNRMLATAAAVLMIESNTDRPHRFAD